MKTSHVLLASLIGTIGSFSSIGSIAWADSIKPMNFYVEVNDTLLLLSTYRKLHKYVKALSHGDPEADPAEFTLTPENFAYAINPSNPHASINSSNPHASINSSSLEGFRLESIVAYFGPTIEPTRLLLSPENMILNGHFYACEQSDSNIRLLYYRKNETYMDSCITVNLYLLSKEAADAKKDELLLKKFSSDTNYKDVKLDANTLQKYPQFHLAWAFFIKVNETYKSLSSKEYLLGIWAFLRKSDSLGSEFKYYNGYAFRVENSTIHNVGFHEHLFSVGYNMQHRMKLKLNHERRLLNSRFYACPTVNNISYISRVKFSTRCSYVEIYFLPYERETGKAITTYGKQKAGKPLPLPSSESGDLPYLLYVKTESVKVAVGHASVPYNDGSYSVIVHGPDLGKPVLFNIKEDSAIAINTPDNGYLGIFNEDLAFGKPIQPNALFLDDGLKLRNSDYFLCPTFGTFQMITTVRFSPTCVNAELYFEHDK